MTSVKVKLRESKVVGKEGKLFIQLIHNREIRVITTKLKVLSSEWNESEARLVYDIKNMSRVIELCEIEKTLKNILKTLDTIINKLSRRQHYTVADIIEMYSGTNQKNLFFKFMKQLIVEMERDGKSNTAMKYASALRQFSSYLKGADISFENVTPELMINYQSYLKSKGMVMNSVSFYMRIMRATYNKAVKARLAPDCNPFVDVYTGVAKTIKRATDEDTIITLQNAVLNPQLAFSRDMFLFSFYTRGMAYVDMAKLKKSDCSDGLLRYERSKTGQRLTIRMEPCITQIINSYAKECRNSDKLLPILECNGSVIKYSTAISLHNKRLKVISEHLGINPFLSSYVARHTWASLARRKGINLSVISEGMGHTSEKTTQIYLSSLDQNILDEANKVIIKSTKKRIK